MTVLRYFLPFKLRFHFVKTGLTDFSNLHRQQNLCWRFSPRNIGWYVYKELYVRLNFAFCSRKVDLIYILDFLIFHRGVTQVFRGIRRSYGLCVDEGPNIEEIQVRKDRNLFGFNEGPNEKVRYAESKISVFVIYSTPMISFRHFLVKVFINILKSLVIYDNF